ncbi:colicin release lysis protein [Serratia ficaria]|nr:colicin release lysis protein [Serratia ficaria]
MKSNAVRSLALISMTLFLSSCQANFIHDIDGGTISPTSTLSPT